MLKPVSRLKIMPTREVSLSFYAQSTSTVTSGPNTVLKRQVSRQLSVNDCDVLPIGTLARLLSVVIVGLY